MTVTLEEAQTKLAELVAAAGRGEDVVVTKDNQPAARIVAIDPSQTRPTPVFGSAKGKIIISEDFDAPLEDFKEYTE